MFDRIVATLTLQAVPELMRKFGLDEQRANGAVAAAGESVEHIVSGGDGFGVDDALNLFSNAKNTISADGMLANIGSVLQGKLMDEVGLTSVQAKAVGGVLLPMITQLIADQVRGNAKDLRSLFGGGGLTDRAKGLFGSLFK